ncbi:MAG: hypothetical protein V2B18_14030 [Pseudomonadota bacterium]
MTDRYQQFLGTNPGIIVDVTDRTRTPYSLRTESGFEFCVSAEDFANYYRSLDSPTPRRWHHLVTDPKLGLADSRVAAAIMKTIKDFSNGFHDFDETRQFLKDASALIEEDAGIDDTSLRERLSAIGWDSDVSSDDCLRALNELPKETLHLLAVSSCGVIPLIELSGEADRDQNDPSEPPAPGVASLKAGSRARKKPEPRNLEKVRPADMKNIELSLQDNDFTIVVDLSQEFGPSKSGKTIIIASTGGNKAIPGREERIGLNVYRQESKKPAKGRRNEFKNVAMEVDGDKLTLKVDLGKEFGASKSGITTIIASTEGNQLVFGREEKIGLNIYRMN